MVSCMLELSTAHVCRKTGEQLTRDELMDVCTYPKGDYGWIVFVDVDAECPEDLKRVMEYADEHRCAWIMFDRDAPECADLPTYEW